MHMPSINLPATKTGKLVILTRRMAAKLTTVKIYNPVRLISMGRIILVMTAPTRDPSGSMPISREWAEAGRIEMLY